MIGILNQLDAKDRPYVLAALAKTILPDPGISQATEPTKISDKLQKDILDEIRKVLKLDPSDSSSLAYSQIYDFLTNLMRTSTRRSTQKHLIKQRVGEKGLLPSSLYSIKFTQQFDDTSFKQGVRREDVRQTLTEPSLVQHFSPRPGFEDATALVSFYTRDFYGPREGDLYTLLVRTKRNNDVQSVINAFRVYHSDIKIPVEWKPLDILKAFIDVYGMLFCIGQSTPVKFLLYDAIPISRPEGKIDLMNVQNPHNHNYQGDFMFRISPLAVVEVAIAFVIDITEYVTSLRDHGVEVKI